MLRRPTTQLAEELIREIAIMGRQTSELAEILNNQELAPALPAYATLSLYTSCPAWTYPEPAYSGNENGGGRHPPTKRGG